MGYLQLGNVLGELPECTSALLSFWFRVPQASITACQASGTSNDPLSMVIPLMCLGPAGTRQTTATPTSPVVACHTFFQFNPTGPVFTETDLGFIPTKEAVGATALSGSSLVTAPTCIGINCNNNPATLFINLQTN